MSFWVVTDACCDLPASFLQEARNVLVVPMNYQIDGTEKELNPQGENVEQEMRMFYQQLLDGAMATTFQISHQSWIDALVPLCEAGHDVLVIVFSSGLSGTCESAISACQELSERFPDRKVMAVDSLCASMGEGLFVHYVLAERETGRSIEECYQFALETVPRVNHWVTVADLRYLRRGGRISASSAYLGSILKIKPIINVDPKGKLIPREKVQGRKRSLRALYEKAEEFAVKPHTQTMFISHADSEEGALWLAEKLKEELHVPEVVVSTIGPIIGSHSGPGTVALFFLDEHGEGRLISPEP